MSAWDDLDGWAGVTVRPITSWPASEPFGERRSPFASPWSSTLELLDHELRMVGAHHVVLELAIDEGDVRLDGKPRARAVARHPGVVLHFDSPHGRLRYATGEFERWQDNLRAIALGLEALRRIERYGIAKRGEQYRGWAQLTTGADDEASVERGRALIREAGSVAAALQATHPDRGGNPVDMRSVLLAREAGA